MFKFMNIPGVNTSCEIALRWMAQNTFDGKLTLVYLSQAWPRTMLPYGITRPQQVIVLHNLLSAYDTLILKWFLWTPLAMTWASMVQLLQSSDCSEIHKWSMILEPIGGLLSPLSVLETGLVPFAKLQWQTSWTPCIQTSCSKGLPPLIARLSHNPSQLLSVGYGVWLGF